MLEKPLLDDAAIITCLSECYGLAVTRLEFLPLGYDLNAGVYRVHADGQDYFLKVREDAVDELSVTLPRCLKQQGFEQVVAPLPTITQDLWGTVDGFSLLLYPFIETRDGPLSDDHWIAFGAALKKLHSAQLPANLLGLLPKETFIPLPKWAALVERLHTEIDNRAGTNPAEQRLAELWKGRRPEIGLIVERAGRLGQMLQGRSSGFVVCHADIHTGNLLVGRDDRLFIVDWDQPVLAPRERDLMFVTVGGFVKEQRHEDLFFQGYGKTDIDPLTMAYYRYERVLEDIALFGESAFLMGSGDETIQDCLKWLTLIFGPGGDVAAAHKLDHVLGL